MRTVGVLAALAFAGLLSALMVAIPFAAPAAPAPTATSLPMLASAATATLYRPPSATPEPSYTATRPAPTSTATAINTPPHAPTRAEPPSRGGPAGRPTEAPPTRTSAATATRMPTATAKPAPPPPPPPPAPSFSGEQVFSLHLLNAARSAHGLPALQLDARISEAARLHAEDMARNNYLAHVNRQGQQPWDRMRAAGAQFGYAAENLGRAWAGDGSSEPAIRAMHDMMMAETPPDDGHRVNVLNNRLRRVGVGTARANGMLYWVCDFAD